MVFDYIIVGAGIAGASLAYRLPENKTAIIIEQESQPGYHSTGRSAAIFIETYGTPTIRALTVASNDFFTNPPAGFVEEKILTPRGVLYVATEEQKDLLEQSYAEFKAQDLDVSELTVEQAYEMAPCLNKEMIVGGVYDNAAQDIDVHGLHQGFLKGAQAKGIKILNDAKLNSANFNDGVWEITFEKNHEPIKGHKIINAAGAWADIVAESCGIKPVGLQPKRRSAFLFKPPADVDHIKWPAVIGIAENFYFKPDAGMLLGSPANADPVDAHDVVAEELDIATGMYYIEEVTNLKITRPSHTWAGLRSFVSDEEFVIGYDDSNANFFWLAGQGGYGIQTAAGASQLALDLLLEQEISPELKKLNIDPAAVSPNRFQR